MSEHKEVTADKFLKELGDLYEEAKDSLNSLQILEEDRAEWSNVYDVVRRMRDLAAPLYSKIAALQSLEAENEELRKVIKGLIQMAEDGQALRRRNNTLVECLTEGDEQIRRARSLLATSPI